MDVTPVGVVRRVRGLAAMGHPDRVVAGWLGVSVDDLVALRETGDADPSAVVALLDVCARMGMQPGRCIRTRVRACEAGWRTLLAWDDHAIDDEAAQPAHLGEKPGGRRVTASDAVITLVTIMAWQGASDLEIAAELRASKATVSRLRTTYGIPSGVRLKARTHVPRPQRPVVHIESGPCPDCQELLRREH